jgi:predicted nucleotide-binding protein (sugar kinase/HSP70/actin superfamily)
MESDLLSYQQQGAKVEELVAGLSYSIVANYLNRVVGRRRIGNNICFQGGTAFNKAVWSAFEKVTGKPIMVPDHHEVTGALGAASIAAEYMNNLRQQGRQARCKFRGFENLASIEYSVESFNCEHCPNECEIKKVQLPKAEPLYYGSRCDRYNLKKQARKTEGFDAFEYRREKLFEMAGLTGKEERPVKAKAKIGIPMALVNWQLLPLFCRFFKLLGFEVVLSGQTNKKIIRKGVESVTAQPCFPVKVAYGHIAELVEKSVDYIFLPSIVSMTAGYPENKRNQLCPYVQSLPYQAQTAFGGELGQTKLLTAVIRMGEGKKLLEKSFVSLGRKLGVPASSAIRAVKRSFIFQAEFERTMIEKGKEILRDTGEDEKLFVLVCRPYNGSDGGVNLDLPKKLAALGVKAIPMDMLDLAAARVGDDELHQNIYWTYGQKILRAAEIIKRDRRLFGIYLSNFSCGPDSFLMTFFKDIMSQKPCLQLELDEHSADAGVITRLEAFLDSLKHYWCEKEQAKPVEKKLVSKGKIGKGRKLYIPYMSDCSYGIAACFRSYGQASEVMPMADEASLLQGRQFTCGKECLPCAVTTGDMLKVLSHEEGKKVSFFMPGSSGPCRFGMYNDLHRLVLKYAGASDAKVISPNQDSNLYKEFTETLNSSGNRNFMKDIWTSAVGIDLLGKVILRIRPFARDRNYAQEVYERSVKAWVGAVEEGSTLASKRELMESIAGEFGTVEMDHGLSKPRIGIVGEIYVRNHPFVNRNIISRLEELGAACDLASVAEWIYYTNFTRVKKSRRAGRLRILFANIIQDYFQKKIEKNLAAPLERRFGKLAEEPIEKVLELARPYLHPSFEGEAILSIGKTVEYYHHGAGGVVNVMPFSCMPSTVVSSHSMRISGDCGGMPILNLSFDGQEDSTLTTRLEAFVEQVCQKQGGHLRPSQFIRV